MKKILIFWGINAIVKHGSNNSYLSLINYIQNHDLKQAESYDYVTSQIDVTNFIDYHISETSSPT